MRRVAVAGRVARVLRVALIFLGLAWGAGELGVRWLLFGEGTVASALGERLRDPNRFADALSEDEFWKLQRILQPVAERDQFARAHAELGWVPARVDRESLAHRAERSLRGRRPVLLYGDSFSKCVVPADECWESLLEESPLGEDLRMLNFGACAYGLDQIVLLLERSIDRYVEEDPIVVIGILVDEDLDRCALSFRGHPKPRVTVRAGGLGWEFPGAMSADAWMAENPLQISSYLGRLCMRSGFSPQSWGEGAKASMIAQKQRSADWLLRRAQELLEARGLDHFVVLFHGELLAQRRAGSDWREAFLERSLGELGVPFVSSREHLVADHLATGRVNRDYFIGEGAFGGHLTAVGNEAVFPAFLDGLLGCLDEGAELARAVR